MVITGFNTEIEVDGTTYHIQTEDKGLDNPMVETLVYWKGGEIIASRRTRYDHFLGESFSEKKVTELMHNQHKEILLAIKNRTFKFIRVEDITPEAAKEEAKEDATLLDSILAYLENKE